MAMDVPTAQRWQRAVTRALAADLHHHLTRRGDSVVVPSKTDDGVTYCVQLAGGQVGWCTCPAGLAGKPCAHRAAVALRLAEKALGGMRIVAVKPAAIGQLERYVRAA